MTELLRLNLGAGDGDIPGFTPIDRKNGQGAYPLSCADGTVDEIRASHILEHFGFAEVHRVLQDWFRALRPGGKIRIAVPDFRHIAANYMADNDRPMQQRYALGGQVDENDFHKSTWDEESLRVSLYNVGFSNIRRWESEINDCASLPVSLNLEGTKPNQVSWAKLPKMIGVMSMPKLAFTENLFCALQVFTPRKIDIIKNTGAYWGQCMERTMVDAINSGAEWVITLDYDTVFAPDQFDRLVYLMAENPNVDALAPWQMKRDNDTPIAWMTNGNGECRSAVPENELDGELVRMHSAHFGLTFIRAEALKKMPHPWFMAVPNSDGEWGEKRFDEDINFWNQWAKAGNTLYMAGHVCIGHLQQVITWPTQSLTAAHQYVSDFQRQGVPSNARR